MTALEKILEKCEFVEAQVSNEAIKQMKIGVPADSAYIRAGRSQNARLMPIIRELCAVIEEQQKAIRDHHNNWSGAECHSQCLILCSALDSTTQRLARLAEGE